MIDDATNICAQFATSVTPPVWTNCDTVSTSLVTRATSDPRAVSSNLAGGNLKM
jgi:hypothetical protein